MELPTKVDLRHGFGEIYDQGGLGSAVSCSVAYALRHALRKQKEDELKKQKHDVEKIQNSNLLHPESILRTVVCKDVSKGQQ